MTAQPGQQRRVWDIIEKVGVCMLTTRFAGGLRARPLEARPDRDAGLIWFVTDIRSGKDARSRPSPTSAWSSSMRATRPICRSPRAPRCGAITPRPRRSGSDRRCLVGGPDDPNVCVLRVVPLHRGIVGRAGEQGGGGLRVRQGATDRREAEPGREPQVDGGDVRPIATQAAPGPLRSVANPLRGRASSCAARACAGAAR